MRLLENRSNLGSSKFFSRIFRPFSGKSESETIRQQNEKEETNIRTIHHGIKLSAKPFSFSFLSLLFNIYFFILHCHAISACIYIYIYKRDIIVPTWTRFRSNIPGPSPRLACILVFVSHLIFRKKEKKEERKKTWRAVISCASNVAILIRNISSFLFSFLITPFSLPSPFPAVHSFLLSRSI